MGRDPVCVRRAQTGRDGKRRRSHRLVPKEPCRLQMPAHRGVCRDSQNLDRQDPKIQAARDGQSRVIWPMTSTHAKCRAGLIAIAGLAIAMMAMRASPAIATDYYAG